MVWRTVSAMRRMRASTIGGTASRVSRDERVERRQRLRVGVGRLRALAPAERPERELRRNEERREKKDRERVRQLGPG